MSCGSCTILATKFKGVRRRKWGKWVSEIRVPGSPERLSLGTYTSPKAAAMAIDIAFHCLRRPSSTKKLNFPAMIPSYCVQHCRSMSPRSVQKVALDAGMAVDTQRIGGKPLMIVTDDQADLKQKCEADRTQSIQLNFASLLRNQSQNLNSGQNQKKMHRRECEEDLDGDRFW